nr:MAG TPA: hypothetical protein [Caudoviricetes sp.]
MGESLLLRKAAIKGIAGRQTTKATAAGNLTASRSATTHK